MRHDHRRAQAPPAHLAPEPDLAAHRWTKSRSPSTSALVSRRVSADHRLSGASWKDRGTRTAPMVKTCLTLFRRALSPCGGKGLPEWVTRSSRSAGAFCSTTSPRTMVRPPGAGRCLSASLSRSWSAPFSSRDGRVGTAELFATSQGSKEHLRSLPRDQSPGGRGLLANGAVAEFGRTKESRARGDRVDGGGPVQTAARLREHRHDDPHHSPSRPA